MIDITFYTFYYLIIYLLLFNNKCFKIIIISPELMWSA